MSVGGGSLSRWPDILANMDEVILNERVIEAMNQEKLTGFLAHPVEISDVINKKLKQQTIPHYYILEPKGRVDLDLKEFGNEKDGWVCSICHNWVVASGGPSPWDRQMRYVPKLKTWDGSDFVKLGNVALRWTLCSRRFIDLACKQQWMGFCFGYWVPGIGIYPYTPPPPSGYVSYLESDWCEKAGVILKAKHPDLFRLNKAEATKPQPLKPRTKSSSPPIQKNIIVQSISNNLTKPRFDLIEAHFKHRVPQPLKALYQTVKELQRRRFAVDVPLPLEVLDRIGEDDEFGQIIVECYEPIDGKTMETWGPGMENYIEFASDGSEGIYCIDPRESDPEVHLFIMDGGDLIPLEVKLSDFLAAPRKQQPIV